MGTREGLVLVSDDGEIIAGHGRVEDAKLLGRKTVPTLALLHLSETERRACEDRGPPDAPEKRSWDERLARRDEAQVEVNHYAEKYAKAKSLERKQSWRQDWHFEQRIFDIINDSLPTRYKTKLENRSYADGASKQGKALEEFVRDRQKSKSKRTYGYLIEGG